jgi:dimethylglycine dehydrogenase
LNKGNCDALGQISPVMPGVFHKQIGMGYVSPDLATVGSKLKSCMLRKEWDVVVVEHSPLDPANARITVDG